ncbi:hypothetical protein F5884DRAFT_662234 [Xylogone sp. PMI_703]|nr:hypothetical protein F5884DRAFT_662234 [Xylogone sp. PMI_703]
MQSFENRGSTATKRLGVSLNVDTGYNKREQQQNISPPETPTESSSQQNQRKTTPAMWALKPPRPGPRETFLDDITPIDPANKDASGARRADNRDSHDLSLSPREVTRDSLVDHMLLSLDQFSLFTDGDGFGARKFEDDRLYSSFGGDDDGYRASSFTTRGPARGHSYSYSSDYENADDASRYSSGQVSRGRRSNSSSNFQSSLGRINSIRNGQIPQRPLHSRSGKGSKASSAGSVDLGYAQITGTQRWAHGLAGRSSSFDYGTDRPALGSRSATMVHQTNPNISPVSPYDYDAAPTPTVPGGPRRARPSSPVVLPHIEQTKADPVPGPTKLERKRSTRSSKSAYKGKTLLTSASVSRFEYNLQDQNTELPPMPAFMKDPAPSPSVSYSKPAKDQPTSTPQPKERPGFFRRVFGSKNHSPAQESPTSNISSPAPVPAADRPGTRQYRAVSQSKNQSAAPPSHEATPTKETPHVLSKKPSSFFRRRKKSISEPEPPLPRAPVQQVHLPSDKDLSNVLALDSPSNSLRQVMNPYLRNSVVSPMEPQPPSKLDQQAGDDSEETERYTRGFSPDYEPDKNATIRTVDQQPQNTTDNPNSGYEAMQKSTSSLSPNTGLGFDGRSNLDRDITFLQDASDNDPDGPTSKSQSTSVARDKGVGSEKAQSMRAQTLGKIDTAKPASKPESQKTTPGSKAGDSKTKSANDDEWVMLSPRSQLSSKPSNLLSPKEKNGQRMWLEPSSSEESLVETSKLALPGEKGGSYGAMSGSTDSVYKSATSLPIVQIEGQEYPPSSPTQENAASQPLNPTPDDRDRAYMIYSGNEDFIQKEKAAAWMGDDSPVKARTLVAYMELFDFANMNILAGLRNLCGKLILRAESQQVDRILDAFAKRWCQCNPNHGFKVTDVVHTICYSILLLNTDLHMADIEQKMTRNQFIKNTMPTVRHSVEDAAPDAFTGKGQDSSQKEERSSIDEQPSWRTSFKPPARGGTGNELDAFRGSSTALDSDSTDCGALVKAPFNGTQKAWEAQVEVVLKDFYNSIRNERLPLHGAPADKTQGQGSSSNTLSVFANGVLRRTPSVLSKAPSESASYIRGRTAETVRANGKWANKNRSRPRLYPSSGLGSSRTSLDDQSLWSPSMTSSTWSKYSLGKTQTSSMSVDSLGTTALGEYHQSIGFANALSQAIIREEHPGTSASNGSDRDELRAAPLLEDESLELHGPPWAKEGIVKHKHHLESIDKRAKDRNWNEVFAVIEKGYMSLFSFSTKSVRNKPKNKGRGAVVGGGNWQENAESLGSFLLRQTVASVLPPPGYSKARPHVWALSLPTGAVHLFQVGTPEIVKEFVTTANYWSARLSNHPLVGAVSNIEYGWSDSVINNALVSAINESTGNTPGRPSTGGQRPSMAGSMRSSSLDQGYSSMRPRLPGDRITIFDWVPPTQNLRSSNLMEADQLKELMTYVAGIEEELQKHNQLRSPMLLAFTPRHMNAQKAMANWEKKSSYLLREIVKFGTYIDSLQAAETAKQRIYAERAAERALAEGGYEDEDEEAEMTLRSE